MVKVAAPSASDIRRVMKELANYGLHVYGPNVDLKPTPMVAYPGLRDWTAGEFVVLRQKSRRGVEVVEREFPGEGER